MTDQWCKPARTTAKNIVTSTRWHLCRLSKLQFWLTTFYKLGGWICCLDMYNIYKSSLMKLFTYLVFNKAKWLLKTRQKFSGSIKPWNFSPDLNIKRINLLCQYTFMVRWHRSRRRVVGRCLWGARPGVCRGYMPAAGGRCAPGRRRRRNREAAADTRTLTSDTSQPWLSETDYHDLLL